MARGIGVVVTSVLVIGGAIANATTALADVAEIARKQQAAIGAVLTKAQLSALTQTADVSASSADAEAYGHALLMRRHLAPAAWMYATAVWREPKRVSAITALGVTLVEGATSGGKSRASEADLATAVELQREAVRLMPKEAAAHHNLGTALLQLAQARGNDRALLEEAANSLRQAVALGGRRVPQFNVRLAEALAALGDRAGAEAALQRAFAANPADAVLMMARMSSLADVPVQGDPPACKAVDFGCKKNCPQGITGRMMMVACEIANASAVEDCRAGKPYPTGYNCESKLPRFGISIPGLDPGFSIMTPWGSIHATVQGNGRVDWKASFNTPPVPGFQAFMGAQGSFNPSTGATTIGLGDMGVQYSILNSSLVAKNANIFNAGTAGVVRYDTPSKQYQVGLDAGGGAVMVWN
jgi:tetratricopeptide (TPR) repeat protein